MYTLSTDNLPILSTLQGWPYGFDSPFKCEVYFVSTRQLTDLKWNLEPIMLETRTSDPFDCGRLAPIASERSTRDLVDRAGWYRWDLKLKSYDTSSLDYRVVIYGYARRKEHPRLDLASKYRNYRRDLKSTFVSGLTTNTAWKFPS